MGVMRAVRAVLRAVERASSTSWTSTAPRSSSTAAIASLGVCWRVLPVLREWQICRMMRRSSKVTVALLAVMVMAPLSLYGPSTSGHQACGLLTGWVGKTGRI